MMPPKWRAGRTCSLDERMGDKEAGPSGSEQLTKPIESMAQQQAKIVKVLAVMMD